MDAQTVLEVGKDALELYGNAREAYELVKGWLDGRRQRRLEEWHRRVLTHPCWALPPADVQEEIRRALEDDRDESRRELIWATVKELVDSVSDAAIPPIASLTAETLHGQRPMDALYRGAVRLLAELSTSELNDLRVLLRVALAGTSMLGSDADVRLNFFPDKATLSIRQTIGEDADENEKEIHNDKLSFDATRLMRLLRENDLGWQTVWVFGSAAIVQTRVSTLRWLARHVLAADVRQADG